MPRVSLVVKRPLSVPYFVLVLVNVQVFQGNVLHGIAGVAPNNTGRDQWMIHIDVSQGNVFELRTALRRTNF